ncbi:hypothetical protein, partial [Acinetobacter baumannii]|uniref:hypothetical protein n=1 Tax=Acinetobacter baumannii TaxID=470 RepID=UPI001C077A89
LISGDSMLHTVLRMCGKWNLSILDTENTIVIITLSILKYSRNQFIILDEKRVPREEKKSNNDLHVDSQAIYYYIIVVTNKIKTKQ